MSDTHVLLPDPARMIEGLRDTGYEFVTAVADIIDNSIAAEATLVDVRINMDYRGNVRVCIADNGIGMDRDDLLNAMKYGSQRRDNPASLGKFGLGLKTASTAFCRRLSVLNAPGRYFTCPSGDVGPGFRSSSKRVETAASRPGY